LLVWWCSSGCFFELRVAVVKSAHDATTGSAPLSPAALDAAGAIRRPVCLFHLVMLGAVAEVGLARIKAS
jgi:hypothetical protein